MNIKRKPSLKYYLIINVNAHLTNVGRWELKPGCIKNEGLIVLAEIVVIKDFDDALEN